MMGNFNVGARAVGNVRILANFRISALMEKTWAVSGTIFGRQTVKNCDWKEMWSHIQGDYTVRPSRVRHGITRVRPRQGRTGRREGASEARDGGEATTYLLLEFPDGRRRTVCMNNMIERLNWEIRRRMRVVGSFPDSYAYMRSCRVHHRQRMEHTPLLVDMSRLMTPCKQRTDHRAMDGHDPKCTTFRTLPLPLVSLLNC